MPLASVPFPAGMNTSKRSLHKNQRREEPELDGPHSIPSTRTGTGTGLNDSGTEKGIPGRGPMGRGSDMSGGERRIARDEAQIARDSAPTTETLKELLQSDPPPWASPSPTPKSGAWDVNTARSNTNQVHTPVRSVLPILGAPVRMEPRIEMSPQSARTQETTGSPFTKGRTNEFLELAEFLMNTPPPPPQAQSLADGAGSRRGSSNLVETEATKPDLPSAENAGMLKSLVSRVTWNKSPDKNGPNGNNGLAFDMSLLERNSSASSSSKLRRKSDTAGNGKSRPGTGGAPSPSYGLFSSRDRHIVDEYIGPSTIGMDGKQQRDRDGGLFRSMVEVGPLPGTGSTKESSILAPDTESHGSANPEFFSPHATSRVKGTSSPLDHFPPGIVTGQSQDPPLKSSPNGVEKVASQSIPLADVLQLRQGMAQAKSANDCQTLVDELLSRYGVWQNVALSP
ncbi:hypothetical protein QFC22_004270 [Naganishia vaughanmartiniae]|uniref:Uncharacterized protein n=1 Tax=Naganishia vaughanmartiniae TaxID=1424756 RepID=A0ACC2X4M5_9TREE|nr:hypothetical protein QFC22_004270 [Naganishia vaughanmartiniae]